MTFAANYRAAHTAANAEVGNFAEKNWDPPRRDKMQSAAAEQLNAARAPQRKNKIQKSSSLALFRSSLTGRTRQYSPTYQLRLPNFESSINESPSVPIPSPVVKSAFPILSIRTNPVILSKEWERAATESPAEKLVILEITCRLPRKCRFRKFKTVAFENSRSDRPAICSPRRPIKCMTQFPNKNLPNKNAVSK
jgi:hypothetical protein